MDARPNLLTFWYRSATVFRLMTNSIWSIASRQVSDFLGLEDPRRNLLPLPHRKDLTPSLI
jgi:hypothetical protein